MRGVLSLDLEAFDRRHELRLRARQEVRINGARASSPLFTTLLTVSLLLLSPTYPNVRTTPAIFKEVHYAKGLRKGCAYLC